MSGASRSPELLFLPGLGTDYRLFAPQADVFENLTVPPWIPPLRKESLPQYAARLAETVTLPEQYILGGISLGGMVAHEMAVHLSKRDPKPSGLILISSCQSQTGVRGWQRLALPAALLPPAAFSLAKPFALPSTMITNRLPKDYWRLPARMFQEQNNRFMQWALSALLRWKSSPRADVPKFHIHGRRDRLIRIKNVEPEEIIDDGGHLINLTHAEQVNDFIARAVASVSS